MTRDVNNWLRKTHSKLTSTTKLSKLRLSCRPTRTRLIILRVMSTLFSRDLLNPLFKTLWTPSMRALMNSEDNKKPTMTCTFLLKKASTLLLSKRLPLKLLEPHHKRFMPRQKPSLRLKRTSCGTRERSVILKTDSLISNPSPRCHLVHSQPVEQECSSTHQVSHKLTSHMPCPSWLLLMVSTSVDILSIRFRSTLK